MLTVSLDIAQAMFHSTHQRICCDLRVDRQCSDKVCSCRCRSPLIAEASAEAGTARYTKTRTFELKIKIDPQPIQLFLIARSFVQQTSLFLVWCIC